MAEGGYKKEYTYPDNDDDMEWWAEIRMGIRDVRGLYASLDYYMSIWPGGDPNRPESEKKFIENYKANLFRMITDYNYSHHKIEEVDTPTTDDT